MKTKKQNEKDMESKRKCKQNKTIKKMKTKRKWK